MNGDRIDLVALRRSVSVVFPNGTEFPIQPFRLDGHRLLAQWRADPDNVELLLDLLRLAVPTATDADLDTLSLEEDVPRVLAAANGKVALMEIALKNGLSGAGTLAPPASLSEHSTPMTPSGPS